MSASLIDCDQQRSGPAHSAGLWEDAAENHNVEGAGKKGRLSGISGVMVTILQLARGQPLQPW
jgi:hypothetical protein